MMLRVDGVAVTPSPRTQVKVRVCTRNVSKDYGQGYGDEFQTGPGSQRRRATARSRGRSFRNDATWPTISGGTRPNGDAGHRCASSKSRNLHRRRGHRSSIKPSARRARRSCAARAYVCNEPVSTNSRFAASRRCSASLVMGCSGPWSASAMRASRRASRAFRAMRFAFS